MGLYIQDNKKHTVRHYCTTPEIESAIETLLREMEDLVSSETHKGYEIKLVETETETENDVFDFRDYPYFYAFMKMMEMEEMERHGGK